MKRQSKTTGRLRTGYLLLAVVVCLVVCSLALTLLARESLQLGIRATKRHRQLQQKWGTISCERSLLPRAPDLFTRVNDVSLQDQVMDDRFGPEDTVGRVVNYHGKRRWQRVHSRDLRNRLRLGQRLFTGDFK